LKDSLKNKVGLLEIKQALNDGRFRDILPLEIRDEIAQYLHCPSCATNINLYRKILKNCRKQLQEYFPGKDLVNEEEEIERLATNNWMVINCTIQELESRLRKLPKGRKQLAICRWEDQVTVIINELEYIF
jgi:hypothetical protein